MKEKSITLLSGNKEENYWNIFIRVNEDGNFNLLNSIHLRNIEDKARRNEETKQYNKTHHHLHKTITLLSGNEEGYWWSVPLQIDIERDISQTNPFRINGEKEKIYAREYKKKHPIKQIFLGFYYEDGYTFTLKQSISEGGRIYGVGYFGCSLSPSDKREKYLHHKTKDLILLNASFEESDLHHMNKNIATYIPRKLHQSIYHSLKRNINMDKINKMPLEFLELENNNKIELILKENDLNES